MHHVSFRKISYQNGLRVLFQPLKTQSVTALVLVGAGSRYEKEEENGISHFLEHMFFKGAKRYKSTKEVSEAIDSVGGDFNAFTGKEYAGYYVKLATEHLEVALSVLSDMLLHARFSPGDIEKERGVILEEYNMYQDTPMYQIGWDFERLLFGDVPLGRDQIGTKKFIQGVTQNQFFAYKKSLYMPDNIVISIAGKFDEKKTAALIQKLFVFEKGKKAYDFSPWRFHHAGGKAHVHNKKTEQAHVVVGSLGLPYGHADHYAAKVLATVLGGNMSSRMFLNVREAEGLAYYIHTSTDDYHDTGVISTRAGVDVQRIDRAISGILREYAAIREKKVPAAELAKSKEYIKGKMVLGLEDSEEYAHLLGRQELLEQKIQTLDEIKAHIDAVTAADIIRVAQKLLASKNLSLAVIGPYDEKDRFQKFLSTS